MQIQILLNVASYWPEIINDPTFSPQDVILHLMNILVQKYCPSISKNEQMQEWCQELDCLMSHATRSNCHEKQNFNGKQGLALQIESRESSVYLTYFSQRKTKETVGCYTEAVHSPSQSYQNSGDDFVKLCTRRLPLTLMAKGLRIAATTVHYINLAGEIELGILTHLPMENVYIEPLPKAQKQVTSLQTNNIQKLSLVRGRFVPITQVWTQRSLCISQT